MKTITHLSEKITVSETQVKLLKELGVIQHCNDCDSNTFHLHREKEWSDIDKILLSPAE